MTGRSGGATLGVAPAPADSFRPLPSQLTSFVGRERELADLASLLETTRLLTLTGAGGSGKTRLAHALAERTARRGTMPVVWVELAALSRPELLASEVADALGVRERGGCDDELPHRTIGDRNVLLVLDNCEHIVDAVAVFVDGLLRGCPNLRVLATSREVLGVSGERGWLVPPLALPDPDDAGAASITEFAATRLFLERAQSVAPWFHLTGTNAAAVAGICRCVNGLPLAIELAAARTSVLTPEQILARLTDAFRLLTSGSRTAVPRHRTLRATIDWSYDLLSSAERLLLQRLSVFAGGFTLDAVERICAGGEIDDVAILDLLAGLVTRSLVAVQERGATARYTLLELIRQYARERLHADADAAAALHRRHADYYIELSERDLPREERHYGPPDWFAIVAPELDNFRAALEWALRNEPHVALRAVGSMFWAFAHASLSAEALRWTEAALAASPSERTADRARALRAHSGLLMHMLELDRALEVQAEVVSIWRELDNRELARDLGVLAYYQADRGELDTALASGIEAVTVARDVADPYELGFPLQALGYVHDARGERDLAILTFRELEQLVATMPRGTAVGFYVHLKGTISSLGSGDIETATRHAGAMIEHVRANPRAWHACNALTVAAGAISARGAPEAAARVLCAEIAIRTAYRILLQVREQRLEGEYAAQLERTLGAQTFARVRAEAQTLTLDEVLVYAARVLAEPAETATGAAPASAPPEAARDGRVPAATLVVRALGPLTITLDGQPLATDAWSYGKPRELLLYLLCHPDGRTREQIGTIFWPEASPTQVKNSFKVMLHHLRRVLGTADRIIADGERCLLNPELDVWFDARVFEQQMAAALRASRAESQSGKTHGAEALLRAAVALYRGDFLSGEVVSDWHLEQHDHLRRLLIDGLTALGDSLLARGETADAAATFEQLIRLEDLREDAHRSLMRCYVQLGQRGRALRQYEQLSALLADELDAEPEPETTRLFESIRQALPA